MNIKLTSIERDTTIQCRAKICMETVNSYADDMTDGAKFPEVELFGTADKCWIGDGWHRIMAADQIGAIDIPAKLNPGGRAEALKRALGANAVQGQRRSNADKRRCVEIAVAEFPKMSSRAIAELCGVSDPFVLQIRQVLTVSTLDEQKYPATCSSCGGEYMVRHHGKNPSCWLCANCLTVTGTDGKQYPATRKPRITTPEEKEAFYLEKERKEKEKYEKDTNATKHIKRGHPSNGMQFARMAVLDLEQITDDDTERVDAFEFVKEWINENYESKNTEND